MPYYTTTLSPGDFLPLFQLMDDYCDSRHTPSKSHVSRSAAAKPAPATPQPSFTPKFDVREAETHYILDGELPGVNQDNIEIEFTNPETMVIKGRVERNYDNTSSDDDTASVHSDDDASSTKSNYHSPTVEDEDETGFTNVTTRPTRKVVSKPSQDQPAAYKFWASERLVGNFQRTFTFPERVNQDGVRATFRNGILSVTVPKDTIQRTKRIRIE